MVQLSQPYMTTGKTTALIICTFVGRVMSLLFNTLSRFVISFPAKKQTLSDFMAAVTVAVILEPKRISIMTSTFSPSICHRVMGPDAKILVFF